MKFECVQKKFFRSVGAGLLNDVKFQVKQYLENETSGPKGSVVFKKLQRAELSMAAPGDSDPLGSLGHGRHSGSPVPCPLACFSKESRATSILNGTFGQSFRRTAFRQNQRSRRSRRAGTVCRPRETLGRPVKWRTGPQTSGGRQSP